LKNLRGVNESSIVLDVGAGTAPFSVLFKPFKSFKVDVLPYEGMDFLTDLHRQLPIKDASFDVLIMSHLLEHISEPLGLLEESYRLLRPKGKLILTIPFLSKSIKRHMTSFDTQSL